MATFTSFVTLLSFLILFSPTQCVKYIHKSQLSQASYLSVEKNRDLLISPNKVFTAGFYRVGRNAFCFAIWFTSSANQTVIWMANRDYPVNGKYSKLKLMTSGDIHLTDAKRRIVWSSKTITTSPVKLSLLDNGNLALINTLSNTSLWQSFDCPTNTLLPNQLMTRDITLISSISLSNHSSGFYKFFFDNDNVLRLLFDGPEISSIYWPDPWKVTWESGRSTYNDSRVAWYDSSGHFNSSDDLRFYAADFGVGPQRRLTLDIDGNLRLYSMLENGGWEVTWLAIQEQCSVHGLCGPNSLCEYVPNFGRKCTCLPGFKLRSSTSWVFGCEPTFNPKQGLQDVEFVTFTNTEFYGYDIVVFQYTTLKLCEDACRNSEDCKSVLLKPNGNAYKCYLKTLLLNGYHSPDFGGTSYLKVPKKHSLSFQKFRTILSCDGSDNEVTLNRIYGTRHKQGPLKFLLVFASTLGAVEFVCIFLVWCFLFKAYEDPSVALQGYVLALTGFKRYTYADLRKATSNFREEIGRGGSGVVYKGAQADGKAIAIKKLNEAGQVEADFLAEVNTIGSLRHMNLIELLGYCFEGKKRLLVLEFMEKGSLAENLCSSNPLGWEKRYEIALGTAKGLAYLHEECLEWVLHCDVKPQNILLDSEYQPKVADFGLSKLVKRDGAQEESNFSRIRGTRGYMAPEWVSNLPITSKVDVYSYGVVMLETLTGKSPNQMEQQALVTWAKELKNATETLESWIEEIADPALEGSYDIEGMKTLALVALQCVEEDANARPSMTQVADLLQK